MILRVSGKNSQKNQQTSSKQGKSKNSGNISLDLVRWSKILLLALASLDLGTIQVLRHQRGGWIGWPNDDV